MNAPSAQALAVDATRSMSPEPSPEPTTVTSVTVASTDFGVTEEAERPTPNSTPPASGTVAGAACSARATPSSAQTTKRPAPERVALRLQRANVGRLLPSSTNVRLVALPCVRPTEQLVSSGTTKITSKERRPTPTTPRVFSPASFEICVGENESALPPTPTTPRSQSVALPACVSTPPSPPKSTQSL